MADFWLGTCDLGQTQPATGSMAQPLLARALRYLAVEVIRMPDHATYAVLLSGADGNDPPGDLDCRVGFTNGARACTAWRDRGFPLVDAEITLDPANMLTVRTPYFASLGAQSDAPPLLVVGPVDFTGEPKSTVVLAPTYQQPQQAPDTAQPATLVRRREATWVPKRSDVRTLQNATLQLRLVDSRSPSLEPLVTGVLPMARAWCGSVELPKYPYIQSWRTRVAPRVDVFGVPAFRFEDVEALGFRIDLPRDAHTRAEVERLIRPLNFHLRARNAASIPDFRYVPLAKSLVIELLRYGRMKLVRQDAPLTMLDYQSQHELVVRLLVGRDDDDGSGVHDEAVFVPAIFVDNPWSKILGRDMQGFPKTLAAFCTDGPGGCEALRPDGRRAGAPPSQAPQPLSNVSSIRLREPTGGALPQDWLMRLDVRPEWTSNWDAFDTVSPGAAMSTLSLAGAQPGWFDLSRLGYLASFLRTAAGQLFNGFRSVQSSPLGALSLGRTWVTGRFAVDDIVQMVFPAGSVRLEFDAPPGSPAGWRKVCRLLAPRPYYDLHASSWYRLRFSMTMSVDDGLEWTQ